MESLDHPNVVKYYGYIQTETDFSIILEFVENGSLSSTLKHFGPLPEKVVLNIVVNVLRGLLYIHERGV
jgi:serine/threonine protein kinase